LLATALRYKTEVRDEDNYFDEIPNVKVAPDMLKLAVHILDSKKGHFEPARFEDRYESALQELIKAKRAGKAPPTVAEPKPSNVINLMDALRRSVRSESGVAPRRSAPKAKTAHPRKRTAARRKVRKAS
jgi:DNA end-binding protein Ku